jgi:hypothetical protein
VPESSLYGLLAEFKDLDALIEASRKVREKGYRKIDAYSPFPSEELNDAIGYSSNTLAPLVFCGGLMGLISGFSMQYIACVLHYPWRVGGKPYNSWPAFIPISYECMILGAALTAVFGMFIMNGLPMPYHPVFNIASFEKASKDGVFLSIEARDAQFKLEETKAFLQSLGPVAIHEVPR